MKIIDGNGAILGRLASYVAKEALKGEEIAVVNCNEIIITGNKKNIKEEFEAGRRRGGSTHRGPIHSVITEKIVKRTIRGMLPNVRTGGRGKEVFKKIRCYARVPKEFENSEMILMGEPRHKFIKVREIFGRDE